MSRGLQIAGRILWIIPALIGLGVLSWASFIYPGIRMRKQHPFWLWMVAVFGVLGIVELVIVITAGEDNLAAGGIYFLIWFAGIVTFIVMLWWWIPFNPNKGQTTVANNLGEEAFPSPIASSTPIQLETTTPPLQKEAVLPVFTPVDPPMPVTETRNESGLSPTVFISHASQDREAASTLAEALGERGINTWIAFRDVQVGANYAEEVVRAIISSNYLLVILSEAAIESPHVRREVTIAIDKGVQLLPVNLSASEDFLWTLPVDWTYWLSLAQVMRQPDATDAASELARRILGNTPRG